MRCEKLRPGSQVPEGVTDTKRKIKNNYNGARILISLANPEVWSPRPKIKGPDNPTC